MCIINLKYVSFSFFLLPFPASSIMEELPAYGFNCGFGYSSQKTICHWEQDNRLDLKWAILTSKTGPIQDHTGNVGFTTEPTGRERKRNVAFEGWPRRSYFFILSSFGYLLYLLFMLMLSVLYGYLSILFNLIVSHLECLVHAEREHINTENK